jgi:hypothetical protein
MLIATGKYLFAESGLGCREQDWAVLLLSVCFLFRNHPLLINHLAQRDSF